MSDIAHMVWMVVIEGAHMTAHVLKKDVHGWIIQYCDK